VELGREERSERREGSGGGRGRKRHEKKTGETAVVRPILTCEDRV
jgi:hypothetical protein